MSQIYKLCTRVLAVVDLKQRRFEYHDSLYCREGELSIAPSSSCSPLLCVDANRDHVLAALRHIVQQSVGTTVDDWVIHVPEGPRQVTPTHPETSNLTAATRSGLTTVGYSRARYIGTHQM
jgi:hypothetical protein